MLRSPKLRSLPDIETSMKGGTACVGWKRNNGCEKKTGLVGIMITFRLWGCMHWSWVRRGLTAAREKDAALP